jgi:hypothetical protein
MLSMTIICGESELEHGTSKRKVGSGSIEIK